MAIEFETTLKKNIFTSEFKEIWYTLCEFFYNREENRFMYEKDKYNLDKITINTIYDLFEILSNIYEVKNSDTNIDYSYLTKIIKILEKEGINFEQLLLESITDPNKKENTWISRDIRNMYLNYLEANNLKISPELAEDFIIRVEGEKNFFNVVNDNIPILFKIIKLLPNKYFTFDWFSKNLENFCLNYENDEDDGSLLNFEAQKTIYDYMINYFPDELDNHKIYYSSLVKTDTFKINHFYQGTFDINIFKLLYDNNLPQEKSGHLTEIAKICLNIVSNSEFMCSIGKNIPIYNMYSENTGDSLILKYATDSVENLNEFEQILQTSIKGLFEIQEEISIQWDDFDLLTNLNAKFVHQIYLYNSLHTNLSKKEKIKQKKI